ncbi:MAG: sulfatase-like hydrolase/transferase [bacterium]
MKLRFLSSLIPFVFVLRLYLLGAVAFFMFRIALFCVGVRHLLADSSLGDIVLAFWMGLRFDLVICSYLLVIPYLLLIFFTLFRLKSRWVLFPLYGLIFCLFCVSFIISAADIPYFNHYFSRLSISALEWIQESPLFVLKMIFQEPLYWLIFIPFFLLLAGFAFVLKRICLRHFILIRSSNAPILPTLLLAFLFLLLMVLVARGRIEHKSPIRVGTAYIFHDPFLNELGLNANFTFLKSYLLSKKTENLRVSLMPDEAALQIVRHHLSPSPLSPPNFIARKIQPASPPGKKYNIVLVIMESMSAHKMTRYGNSHQLTPFLDQLYQDSIAFDNIYTAGIHTFNGVYGTLFSFPSLFRQHPMKKVPIPTYYALPHVLSENGYYNVYFTTHDDQFDNIGGFLRSNAFDKIFCKKDYPPDKVVSILGVPDDYMFNFAIPKITHIAKNSSPFFATLMTSSDHGPYHVPNYFTPQSTEIKNQIVEYADWSIQTFMNRAKKEPWYSDTIFVFIADHGVPMSVRYEIPLSFTHTPFIIYAPHIFKRADKIAAIGGQIDVGPTLLGLLKIPYENHTFGIDLLQEKRPAIYFNGDDKYAVIDDTWLLISFLDKRLKLYKYRSQDTRDYKNDFPDVVNRLKRYGDAHLQACQLILDHQGVSLKSPARVKK